jgi:hypothetical protein
MAYSLWFSTRFCASNRLELGGAQLSKMDWFGKSDPWCEILRGQNDGSWVAVTKTEVIKETLDPRWKPFSINVSIFALHNAFFLHLYISIHT